MTQQPIDPSRSLRLMARIPDRRRLLAVGLALVLGMLAAPATAQTGLPAPVGDVILTVSGAIGRTNAPDGAEFDRAGLERLGLETIRTATPYTKGVQAFTGVSLKHLLEALDAHGHSAVMTALNDYRIEVPLSDADNPDVILALDMGGKPMTVRDKGPIWLVYPLDSDPELNTRATHEKMIWQLRRIEIR